MWTTEPFFWLPKAQNSDEAALGSTMKQIDLYELPSSMGASDAASAYTLMLDFQREDIVLEDCFNAGLATVVLTVGRSGNLWRLNIVGRAYFSGALLCVILAQAKHLARLEAMSVSWQVEKR